MKAMILAAGFALMGVASAEAKLAPVEPPKSAAAVSVDDVAMTSEPLGAMLESDYFRAPAPTAAGRVFPCRLQLRVFDKTRLAQSCH